MGGPLGRPLRAMRGWCRVSLTLKRHIDTRTRKGRMAKGTVYVLDELWIPFRQQCLARRTSASKVVTQLVQEQLQRWEKEPVSPPPKKQVPKRS
jgi:hypothetical protein